MADSHRDRATALPSGEGEGVPLPDVVRGALSVPDQRVLSDEIGVIVAEAPLFRPTMPRTGKPFSVRMTNCGSLGWVSDQELGYRYQSAHPATGRAWPEMPRRLIDLWDRYARFSDEPEACLVNAYSETARMGLHRDEDEEELAAPVLSVSLGDDCRFRIGGTTRRSPTRSFRIHSGDIVVLSGPSRLAYHGVDRIYPGTSGLELPVPDTCRINLTLRRVRPRGTR